MHARNLPALARNIQRVRTVRGLTLSGLSQRSGIAKSTLSQIESGNGNPTIETVWAIANALETPFGALVGGEGASPQERQPELHGAGEKVRFIERYGEDPVIEVYVMNIGAGHSKASGAHAPGVHERVMVLTGEMLVGDAARSVLLRAGETHWFKADVGHVYAAPKGDATAMVFIEYPRLALSSDEDAIVRDYPQSPSEWDGLRAVVDRAMIDVAQGFSSVLIRLPHRGPEPPNIKQQLGMLNQVTHHSYGWPLMIFEGKDERGAYLAVLPQIYTMAFCHAEPHAAFNASNDFRIASSLAKLAEHSLVPLRDDDLASLERLANSPSWAVSTLASEVALQRGYMFLPSRLDHLSQRVSRKATTVADDDFSSRINVDHYDAFELLHPAYARQVVAIAEDIATFGPGADEHFAVDIGSGPGATLLMLLELLPSLQILAVAPDEIAFGYLTENAGSAPNIQCLHADFLEIEIPPHPITVLTSVGSSHHFNTAFMLQKAYSLLDDSGVLCVADEFLPVFKDAATRNNALIRHHSAYILASMASLDRCCLHPSTSDDSKLYRYSQDSLVHAILEAQGGKTAQATRRCRDLYSELNRCLTSKKYEETVGAFVRFYGLEIQAMVAGFDYEVERKTYPRRFLSLAQAAGFQLSNHRRIFGTTGSDDFDGGTHVFTFTKRGGSLSGAIN